VFLWLLFACGAEPTTPPVPNKPTLAIETKPATLPIPVGTASPKTTPIPLAKTSGVRFATETLSGVIDTYARDPSNPWAIGHGLLANGGELRLSNDEDAIAWLFATYAERFQVSDDWLLRFPDKKGDTRIEPHTDLLLKALTDAGIDPERAVRVQGHDHQVGDLFRGSLSEAWFNPNTKTFSYTSPNDVPWSLQGLSSWAPANLEWTSKNGHNTTLDSLADFGLATLIESTQFLATAKKQNIDFQKRGQGIFKFTCGGAHLIQGVAHATARGFGDKANRTHVQEQLHLLMYRFPRELSQIDAAAKQHPAHELKLRVQRLKLTGHTLETLHRVAAYQWIGSADKTVLEQVAAEVVKSVVLLHDLKAFDALPQIKMKDEQLFLDIVGDSAHALRGLRIATGESGVYY
jgi:hypothetical protein